MIKLVNISMYKLYHKLLIINKYNTVILNIVYFNPFYLLMIYIYKKFYFTDIMNCIASKISPGGCMQ